MGQDGKAVGRLKEHAICGAGIDAEPNKEPYREPQRFGLAWLRISRALPHSHPFPKDFGVMLFCVLVLGFFCVAKVNP